MPDGSDLPTPKDATGPIVYLHIGPMKTGTSFIQDVLIRNLDVLSAAGILYPTDHTNWALQVRAARDALQIKGARPSEGAWATVIGQIEQHLGRAVLISMEFFSFATRDAITRILADLSAYDVQIIVTARDFVRILPSTWQSMVKQGHAWSFVDFLASVTAEDTSVEPAKRFWRQQDVAEITERWRSFVGADHIHVVTVPPGGAPPDTLWRRFADVIGVAAEDFDIEQDKRSNLSLNFSDTELLRHVNLAVDGRLSRLAQKRWATRWFANRVLRSPPADGKTVDRPSLDDATHQWAVEKSRQAAVRIGEMGVNVYGDLAELIPSGSLAPPCTSPARQPGVEATIIAELLVRLAQVDPEMPDSETAGTPFDESESGDDDLA